MMNLNNLKSLPTKQEIQREKIKRSLWEFVKEFWDVIIEDPLKENWHMPYLCNELEIVANRVFNRQPKEYDLIINIPPGTTKSTIATVMYPVWCWVNDPSIRFITGSYSLDLSTEHSVFSRDIINSEKFQTYYRDIVLKYDKKLKRNYENTKKGSRSVASVGGTITGKHGHIIIIDDPLNPKGASSETERETANKWMDATLSSRKVEKELTPTILIMQRLHEDDCSGHWLKKRNKALKQICLPGELTKDVKPESVREMYVDGLLDPKRMSKRVLSDMKIDMGSRVYAGQVLQTPSPADGDIIKESWYKRFIKADIPESAVNFYTDSAYGKEESDNSATIAYSVHNGDVYVWGCYAWNLGFPDFIKRYRNTVTDSGYTNASRCYFEPKASGVSIVQQLKREGGLNIIEDKPPTESKVSRVSSASASIEAGRVYLLKDGVGMDKLVSESIIFPNGANDDCIDALASVIRIEITSKRNSEFGTLSYI